MIEREKIIKLYDIYKNLLTDKQKEYFEYYYFEDLSLNEIGENLSVTKSLVGKTINTITDKLNEYDEKLGLFNLYEAISNIKDKDTREYLESIIKQAD